VIVPALSETRDESMPEFVSRRCDFVRVSSGCAASLKNKVGPLVNGVAAKEVPNRSRRHPVAFSAYQAAIFR
jgi:hypothetical protein